MSHVWRNVFDESCLAECLCRVMIEGASLMSHVWQNVFDES